MARRTQTSPPRNPWGLAPSIELKAWRLVLEYPQLRITSGRRTARQNKRAGGVVNSKHLRGEAVDYGGPRSVLLRAAQFARDQLGLEALVHDAGSGEHLHLEVP